MTAMMTAICEATLRDAETATTATTALEVLTFLLFYISFDLFLEISLKLPKSCTGCRFRLCSYLLEFDSVVGIQKIFQFSLHFFPQFSGCAHIIYLCIFV